MTANPIPTTGTPITPAIAKTNSGMLMGLNVSLLECIFILMEFIFGTVIFPAIWRLVLQYPCRRLYDQVTCDEIYRILGYFTIAYWLINRLSWAGFTNLNGITSILKITFDPWICLSTLYPKVSGPNGNTQPKKISRGMKIFIYFILAHVVSIIIMFSLQIGTGTKFYTLDNFYVAETSTSATPQLDSIITQANSDDLLPVDDLSSTSTTPTTPTTATTATTDPTPLSDPPKVFSPLHMLFLMILAPLFEEVIFRCVMLTLVHLRLTKYFPGQEELTERLNKKKTALIKANKDAKGAKKIVMVRKKQECDELTETTISDTTTTTTTTSTKPPSDKRYKTPPFNIAQYSSVLSAIAFGLIHFINLVNGHNIYYVSLQAIVGIFIGIILNAAAYNHGHFFAFVIHAINNIIASFISQNTDIFSSNLLIFGFIETIACYGVLAYLSFISLSNTESEEVHAVILPKLPLPYPDNYVPDAKENEKATKDTLNVPIELEIPRHYHAFNNHIVRSLSQQIEMPVSSKTAMM